jgi:hypothetical protein
VSDVARGIHLAAIWLFAACSIVQVFLAGLGVFVGPDRFALHRDFGYMFGFLLLLVIAAAVVGRLGRGQILFAIALMILFTLQSVLIAFREGAPEIAALHPVNGFLIIAVAFVSGREALAAWRLRARTATAADGDVQEPGTSEAG